MAKMEESLISWNLPNFVSFIFFIAILWVAIGALGHIFVRRPAMKAAAMTAGPAPSANSDADRSGPHDTGPGVDYADMDLGGSVEPGP